MDELQRILERDLGKLPSRILGHPQRSTLDRASEASLGVRFRGHERMFSRFDGA
jgi:hypothetical protein